MMVYAHSGNQEQVWRFFKRPQVCNDNVSPGSLAMLYIVVGEREETFAALETAYEAHDLQLEYLSSCSRI